MRKIDNTRRITARNVLDEIINLGQLVLEITDECNLSCRYCAYGELYGGYDTRESQYMRFEDAKAIIDYLVDLWGKYPTVAEHKITDIAFYGGEPLLNFSLIRQVVDYVESLKSSRRFEFSMTSNCLLLDRYMDFLVEKKIRLLCSLDGDRSSDGYRVHHDGSPSFDKVFNNIHALQEKYPEYFNSYVSFNSVLHNLNSVEEVTTFIKHEFGKIPTLSELSTVGVRPDRIDDFKKAFTSVNESLHEARDYPKLRKELGVLNPEVRTVQSFLYNTGGDVFSSYRELLLDETLYITPTGTCTPFNRKMFVKVDGKILQCERILHNYALGIVRNGVVSLNLEEIAKTHNSYLDKVQSQCSVCARKHECSMCLFEMDLSQDRPVCKDFMNSKQYDAYRKACLSYIYKYPETYRMAIFESIVE